MQNYFIILIVLIGNIFSMPNNRKETVLLIEVNSQIQSLKIINSEQYLVDYLPFNKYLIDSGVNKIEKWNNAASDNDIYNEINFSKIYRVFFKENSCRTNARSSNALNSPIRLSGSSNNILLYVNQNA